MNDIANAHYTLSKAALDDGQVDQAITHLEAALKLDPDFIEAHHALALCYFSQHKLQEAKNAAQDALKIDPSYEPALYFLQAIAPQEPKQTRQNAHPVENTKYNDLCQLTYCFCCFHGFWVLYYKHTVPTKSTL